MEMQAKNNTKCRPTADCHFWLETGKCRDGDKCQFIHNNEKRSSVTVDSTKPFTYKSKTDCRNWIQTGSCSAAENCPFQHHPEWRASVKVPLLAKSSSGIVAQSFARSQSSKNLKKSQSSSPQGRRFSQVSNGFFSCDDDDDVHEMQSDVSTAPSPRSVSNQSNKNIKIIRSRTLKSAFSDATLTIDPPQPENDVTNEPEETNQEKNDNQDSVVAEVTETKQKKKRKKRVKDCHFWLEKGSCRDGDQCKFAHREERARTVPADPTRSRNKSTRHCYWWVETGTCEDGDACPFRHWQSKRGQGYNAEVDGVSSACSTPSAAGSKSFKMFSSRLFFNILDLDSGRKFSRCCESQKSSPSDSPISTSRSSRLSFNLFKPTRQAARMARGPSPNGETGFSRIRSSLDEIIKHYL